MARLPKTDRRRRKIGRCAARSPDTRNRPSKGVMKHIDLIAAKMEQARWERGIPVAELARRIGIDRKRLWRVLNGERAMHADEFVRLCAVLGLGFGRFLPPSPALFPEEPPAPFPPQIPRAPSDFERVVHDEVAEDLSAELPSR